MTQVPGLQQTRNASVDCRRSSTTHLYLYDHPLSEIFS